MIKVKEITSRAKNLKILHVLAFIAIAGSCFLLMEKDSAMNHKNLQILMQLEERVETAPVSPNTSFFKSQNKGKYQMKSLVTANGSAYCSYKAAESDQSFLRLKDFFRDEYEWKNEGVFNIFLMETSCSSWPSYRVWCSIESMAEENPEGIVWYVMTAPQVYLNDGIVKKLLSKYMNLRIVTVDLREVFKGTPLYDLYQSEKWYKATGWPAANLGNMIRLAMIWHAGGFYSDTDVICIAPLTKLRNVVGLQNSNLVNGAAFHFTKHHPLVKHFMAYINANFNPHVWGKNGPQTISAVLREVCNKDTLFSGLKCLEMEILPQSAFYPIEWHKNNLLFQSSLETDINKKFPNSYIIHFWNRVSRVNSVIKDSGSIYDLASSKFCPSSRETATVNNILF